MKTAWHFSLSRFGLVLALAVPFFAVHNAVAQTDYQPSSENLQARREFQDMKFGMFIHWGVYSVLGDGEWVSPRSPPQARRIQSPPRIL